MVHVPSSIRLLLAVVVMVGITLLAAKVFRRQIMELATKDDVIRDLRDAELRDARDDGKPADSVPPAPPRTSDLFARVVGMTTSAFVFLTAFTLGQYWGASNQARAAVVGEAGYWAQAAAAARQIPADKGGNEVVAAIDKYRESVLSTQWEGMQRADSEAVQAEQLKLAQNVGMAMLKAEKSGADTTDAWSTLTGNVSDMLTQSRERLNSLPNPSAPGVLVMIFLLGIVNLALITAFQPSRRGTNIFLLSVLAGVTAFLCFIVVETSNPYVGGARVHPPLVLEQPKL